MLLSKPKLIDGDLLAAFPQQITNAWVPELSSERITSHLQEGYNEAAECTTAHKHLHLRQHLLPQRLQKLTHKRTKKKKKRSPCIHRPWPCSSCTNGYNCRPLSLAHISLMYNVMHSLQKSNNNAKNNQQKLRPMHKNQTHMQCSATLHCTTELQFQFPVTAPWKALSIDVGNISKSTGAYEMAGHQAIVTGRL